MFDFAITLSPCSVPHPSWFLVSSRKRVLLLPSLSQLYSAQAHVRTSRTSCRKTHHLFLTLGDACDVARGLAGLRLESALLKLLRCLNACMPMFAGNVIIRDGFRSAMTRSSNSDGYITFISLFCAVAIACIRGKRERQKRDKYWLVSPYKWRGQACSAFTHD